MSGVQNFLARLSGRAFSFLATWSATVPKLATKPDQSAKLMPMASLNRSVCDEINE